MHVPDGRRQFCVLASRDQSIGQVQIDLYIAAGSVRVIRNSAWSVKCNGHVSAHNGNYTVNSQVGACVHIPVGC